jgi:hypothetical protein
MTRVAEAWKGGNYAEGPRWGSGKGEKDTGERKGQVWGEEG